MTATLEDAMAAWLAAADAGTPPTREAFLAQHPDHAAELAAWLDDQQRMLRVGGTPRSTVPLADGRPPRPLDPADELPAGSQIGPYVIEGVLGRGGMGVIHRARHTALDKPVALKLLAQRLAADPDLVARFQREARALARLDHPHVVRVHDLGSDGTRHWIVMELVEGVTLRELMLAGEMTSERALALVPPICSALEAAHELGIVHRDIKPENILVDTAGTPKVADFGLARLLDQAVPDNLTQTAHVMGTYDYMAPEQRKSARVDHRADIYAMGVVLYEMLTGQLPEEVPYVPPSQRTPAVDARLDEVVLRALRREPDERYQKASDLARDVSDIGVAEPGPAPRPRARPADADGPLPLRTIALREGKTHKPLCSGEAVGLRLIIEGWVDVNVRGWPRDEVELTGEWRKVSALAHEVIEDSSFLRFRGASSDVPRKVLVVTLEQGTTIHVPSDLPLEIHGPSTELKISGLRAPLWVGPGDEKLKIRDHEGPLHADRVGGANLDVSGLRSERFDLLSENGRVRVNGMRLTRGSGRLGSIKGDVSVGVVADGSNFTYELESLAGDAESVLGESTGDEHLLRGQVGDGLGTLSLTSQKGEVRLGPQGEFARRAELSDNAQSMLWAVAVGFFCFTVLDWQWIGWAVMIFWFGGSLLGLAHAASRGKS